MRERLSIGLLILTGGFLAGCGSSPAPSYQSYLLRVNPSMDVVPSPSPMPQSFSATSDVTVREVHLSLQEPVDPSTKIQLVSIDRDLTTTIRTESGATVSGKPGQFFSWPGGGSVGLQLLSASAKDGEVLFEQRGLLHR